MPKSDGAMESVNSCVAEELPPTWTGGVKAVPLGEEEPDIQGPRIPGTKLSGGAFAPAGESDLQKASLGRMLCGLPNITTPLGMAALLRGAALCCALAGGAR